MGELLGILMITFFPVLALFFVIGIWRIGTALYRLTEAVREGGRRP